MIKVWDYLNEYEQEKQDIHQAIESVLESGWLILGDNVLQFEKELAAFHGVSHGIGVNSGTDALFIALKALGVGPGDEVVTVPNTAVPTVAAIDATGADPVFVDIEEQSFLMDVDQLESAITHKTKCVLPVHLYGRPADMERISRIAEQNNLSVLEDCAQSTGAEFHGKKTGSLGHIAAFSFYPTKVLGTYGDGGMVLTNDAGLAEKARRLRFYGMEKTYYALEPGYNSRLDELHAAILRSKLPHLENYIARRREIARRYRQALSDTDLVLPEDPEESLHVYYVYVVRHPERDRIIEELKKRDISLNISYPWPIHTMPAYERLGYKKGAFPVAERLAGEIFSLPMYPGLTDAEQDTVIDRLLSVLRSFS